MDLRLGPWELFIAKLNRRYEVRYKFNRKHLVADVLLFCGIISLIVFNWYVAFVFTKFVTSLQVKVAVTVSEPVVIGAPLDVRVDYYNNTKQDELEGAVLRLALPPDFTLERVEGWQYQVDNHELVVSLGTIHPQSGGSVVFRGALWADYGQQYHFSARLDYRQANILAESLSLYQQGSCSNQTRTCEIVSLNASLLDCRWRLPSVVVSGSSLPAALSCQNNYPFTLTSVQFRPLLPIGSTVRDSQPALDQQGSWFIRTLAPGQSVDWSATIQLGALDQPTVIWTTAVRASAEERPTILLDQPSLETAVFIPRVTLRGAVNGQTDYALLPGESLEYVVSYVNNESETVQNAAVALDLANPVLLITSLESAAPHTTTGRQVVFALGALASGASGQVSFTIQTVAHPVATTPTVLEIMPALRYDIAYQGQQLSVNAEQPSITARLSSDLALEATARYYTREGEQLGIGPLPPIVGYPTQYRLVWQVSVMPNPVTDVVISGVLPNNVAWVGGASMTLEDQLTFDGKSRVLSLTIPRLEPGARYGGASLIVSFPVEITPQQSQVGSSAVLMRDVKITGRDAVTGRDLENVVGTITTNLSNDPKASGRGKVVGL